MAFARVGFKPLTIEDRQPATDVTHPPGVLEGSGRNRDVRAPHPSM
jgi:hypothetical protein